jgi:hypothetical protein
MSEYCEACGAEKAASEGSVVETQRAKGPSFSSPGEPPEYDWICFECQEGWADHLYDYDDCEEELWNLDDLYS